MDLIRIENFALCGYTVYFSAIDSIALLPGINLVKPSEFEKLKSSAAFQHYRELGLVAIVDEPLETKRDDRTDLIVTERQGELIPVQNAIVNNKSMPVVSRGKTFALADLIKKGISSNTANQIAMSPPSEGWVDKDHILNALEIKNEKDVAKIASLF